MNQSLPQSQNNCSSWLNAATILTENLFQLCGFKPRRQNTWTWTAIAKAFQKGNKEPKFGVGSTSKSQGIWTEDDNARLKITNIDERCSIMWCLLGAELQKSAIVSFFGGRKDLQVLKFINNLALQLYYSPSLASSFKNQCPSFY